MAFVWFFLRHISGAGSHARTRDGIQGAILDSPVPAAVNLGVEAARLAAASLEHLFTACNDNLACRVAYPDLENRFFALVEQLNATPLPISLGPVMVSLTGDHLASLMPTLLGTPTPYALAPALIADLEKGRQSDWCRWPETFWPRFSRNMACVTASSAMICTNR